VFLNKNIQNFGLNILFNSKNISEETGNIFKYRNFLINNLKDKNIKNYKINPLN